MTNTGRAAMRSKVQPPMAGRLGKRGKSKSKLEVEHPFSATKYGGFKLKPQTGDFVLAELEE
jgi:hypothetical protein